MYPVGRMTVQTKTVPLTFEWNEYDNSIMLKRGSQVIALSYDDARAVYKFLFILFGRVAMPEIH